MAHQIICLLFSLRLMVSCRHHHYLLNFVFLSHSFNFFDWSYFSSPFQISSLHIIFFFPSEMILFAYKKVSVNNSSEYKCNYKIKFKYLLEIMKKLFWKYSKAQWVLGILLPSESSFLTISCSWCWWRSEFRIISRLLVRVQESKLGNHGLCRQCTPRFSLLLRSPLYRIEKYPPIKTSSLNLKI